MSSRTAGPSDLRGSGEDGFALVAAIGASSVVMLLLLLLLQASVAGLLTTRRAQDTARATAAAQAGVDEYLSRLIEDPDYWQQANGDSTNAAFSTAGRSVPGSGDGTETYRYQVLSSTTDVATTGAVRVKVVGRATNNGDSTVSRTLTATYTTGRQQYAYLSDKEVLAPDIMYLHQDTSCDSYWYTGRSAIDDADPTQVYSPNDCHNQPWTSKDVVEGPLQSNDALEITGTPTFDGPATSSWPAIRTAGKTWWGAATSVTGQTPRYGDAVALPDGGTGDIRAYTSPYASGGVGCYYRGATKIVFTGSTMSVLSPGTSDSRTPSRCYDASSARRSTLQTGLAIPPVIYVDSAASQTCSASWKSPNTVGYPSGGTNATAEYYDDDVYARESPDGQFGPSPAQWGWAPNYCAGRGTAYVSGEAAGSVTVATQDDVVIAGDLTVPSLTGTAMIGLRARSCVFVRHATNQAGTNLGTPVSVIQASIIAQENSFLTQYWTHGAPLGTLTVTGSVTTKYKGPMYVTNGTGTHGYSTVKYVLDDRLRTAKPPYWPDQPTPTSGNLWKLGSVQDN